MWISKSFNILSFRCMQMRRCMYCKRAGRTVAEEMEFKDAASELQQFLRIPLFRENERPFTPSVDEMKNAQKLFIDDGRENIGFKSSVVNIEECPEGNLPEVVFIGQSNVGKSSLIKAIFSKCPKLVVKTSKKPGHTRTINFFQIKKKLMIVDVPGYGFRQPEHFVQSVEGYLRHRSNLKRTFFIVDSQIGLNDWDSIAIEMLEEFGVPYALVMTKIDLAPQSRRLHNLRQLQEIRDKFMSPCCFPQPFLVSAKTNEGIGYLQSFVAYITGNASFKGL